MWANSATPSRSAAIVVVLCCRSLRREILLLRLRQTSEQYTFAVFAYCQMPDHLHLVLEGKTDDSDFLEFMSIFKQRSSFDWKQQTRTRLWQDSFYDHVLRDSESTRKVVRYVLENPVRAGLVASPSDYEHSGSFVFDRQPLIEWAFGWNRDE